MGTSLNQQLETTDENIFRSSIVHSLFCAYCHRKMGLLPVCVLIVACSALFADAEMKEHTTTNDNFKLETEVKDNHLEVKLTAPAGGWVGFGLSKSGKMGGSDFAMITHITAVAPATEDTKEIKDMFVPGPDSVKPTPDAAAESDWKIVSAIEKDGKKEVHIKRALKGTSATEDVDITEEPLFLLVASGEIDDTIGFKKHSEKGKTAAAVKLVEGPPPEGPSSTMKPDSKPTTEKGGVDPTSTGGPTDTSGGPEATTSEAYIVKGSLVFVLTTLTLAVLATA